VLQQELMVESRSGQTYLGRIGLVAWEWTQRYSTSILISKDSRKETKQVSLRLSVRLVQSSSSASPMLSSEMIDTLFKEVLPQRSEVLSTRALPAGH